MIRIEKAMIARIAHFGIMLVAAVAIILAIIPWYANHLQNASLSQAEMGFKVEALQTAEKAVSFNPLSVQALFVLAGAQERIGREKEAKNTLVRATEIQPQNYLTWEQLALYERDRWHEPEEAAENFKKAVNLNPLDQHLRIEAGLPEEESTSSN